MSSDQSRDDDTAYLFPNHPLLGLEIANQMNRQGAPNTRCPLVWEWNFQMNPPPWCALPLEGTTANDPL